MGLFLHNLYYLQVVILSLISSYIPEMNFYTIFAFFAILAVASVSGHRCRGSSYGGGGRGGRGGAIIIGSNNPNKS
ncbi:hypothetical protein B9Z55_011371 [Caenorhabditis nigoni]|uniref:Uncharacterized protein n=1 Tax=Caenorhabditis nigoni TaxID=1611254 RepID=A0A2G5UK20_9PELO|nr:hypothetical protein B9Z55_011371 [Caenorhabditis nigoni]